MLLVTVIAGAGFAPNLASFMASVTNVTGEITSHAILRGVQWGADICEDVTPFEIVLMPSSQDVYNKLADGLLPRNETIANLLQEISERCSELQYALTMESTYAPGTMEQYSWYLTASYVTALLRQDATTLNFTPYMKLPIEILMVGFDVSVTLTLNNMLPLKITSVKTNQSIQATSFAKSCDASCSFSGTLTLGSGYYPHFQNWSWAPIRVTLTIYEEVPIVWWSFKVSSSNRTLTTNLELNPATGTVRLA
jgi:hypothetical protein